MQERNSELHPCSIQDVNNNFVCLFLFLCFQQTHFKGTSQGDGGGDEENGPQR